MRIRRDASRPTTASPARTYVTGIFVATVGLAVIVFSPYLIASIPGRPGTWQHLSDVGQAYGGISAVLSGVALCAVGLSFVLQRRQALVDRSYADRQVHFDLIRLAIEDPMLLEVLDLQTSRLSSPRQLVYANLWMAYWRRAWLVGEVDDHGLKNLAGQLFQHPVAYEWWAEKQDSWLDRTDALGLRFVKLVTAEWRVATPVAMATTDPPSPPPYVGWNNADNRVAGIAVASLVGAAVVVRFVYRRKTRDPSIRTRRRTSWPVRRVLPPT